MGLQLINKDKALHSPNCGNIGQFHHAPP